MTINPRTNAVELTTDDIRKAIAAYLKQSKFNIHCEPTDVKLEVGNVAFTAEVNNWDNEPEVKDSEELFLVQQ
jgi:flavin reductase (DIM6/NTAB) family NADH-FMN oxidoreductase RutF